jgi:hypothetical protein
MLADPNFGRYPGLHYEIYPQDAFRTVESEQLIRITRSPKRVGDDGLEFWLAAERMDGLVGREEYFRAEYVPGVLRRASFQVITEAEFNEFVGRWSAELLAPPRLPLHASTGFVGSLLMFNAETDLIASAFAEYEDEFLFFSWESSA